MLTKQDLHEQAEATRYVDLKERLIKMADDLRTALQGIRNEITAGTDKISTQITTEGTQVRQKFDDFIAKLPTNDPALVQEANDLAASVKAGFDTAAAAVDKISDTIPEAPVSEGETEVPGADQN